MTLRDLTAAEILQRLSEPPAFGHFADFRQCVVKEPLNLSDRDLCGCDFSGTVFEQDVRCDRAVFRGLSWFRGAEFRAAASFEKSCFFNDARFDEAWFHDTARFDSADFRGVATFDRCRANAGVVFADVLANGNFSIADADLVKEASFTGALMMGGLWRKGTGHDRLGGLKDSTIFGRR